MKADERNVATGEVIFREGDAGDAVYVILDGRIELLKAGPEGPVVVASLGPGQMAGEMGVLDDGPRNASAVAATDSLLRVVTKKDFRAWLKQDPEATGRVIGLLVDRLRRADDLLVQPLLAPAAPATGWRRFRIVQGLLGLIGRLRGERGVAGPAAVAPAFRIAIAAINNDVEGAWGRALADLFADRPGLAVQSLGTTLPVEVCHDQTQVAALVLRARQVLAREPGADLLLWGDVHADGFSLMFTPAQAGDDERPGAFGPCQVLELAGDLESPVAELLAAACLAAIEPVGEARKALQRQLLPAALEAMGAFLGDLPVAWTLDQQRTGLACYGHAAATIASWDGDAEWYDHAAEAYRAALNRLPQGEHGLEQAILRKHLGLVLAASADKRQDAALMEQAVEEYRTSAECLVRGAFAQEWAAAQNRLGLALNRLDHLTGQPELLKEALGAFQAAAQVFTRSEAPLRWADTMFNLAEVLLVYGDQVKNTEVLERAVDAARAALEYRSRERSPAAWAAGQNTLGTALFLLDKHGRSALHVEEATQTLTQAAETYRSLGATRQAETAERNLAHVEKLAKTQGGRKTAQTAWDGEPAT